MTPEQLHAAVDERRQALHLPWWRIAIQLQIGPERLTLMRRGRLSKALRERVETWLIDQS